MSARAFDFIEIPERSGKPRRSGLTLARDLGVGYGEAESYMEAVGEFIDFIKIRHLYVLLMGMGKDDLVRRKVELYKRHKIDVNPGGIVFEMAVLDNAADRTFDRLAELGFTAVECSENIIPLALEEKLAHIRRAKSAGLKVMFEVGEKYPTGLFDVKHAADDMNSLLDGGCDLLILERSIIELCLGKAGEKPESERLIELVERVGLDKIVFEAEASPHQVWLFDKYGPDVNLGPNLDLQIIAKLEPTRRTLSREGGYGYMIDRLKQRRRA
jgi:phosphosulfolactate synthase